MMSLRLLLVLCACLLVITVEQTRASQLAPRTSTGNAILPRLTISYNANGTHVIFTCRVEDRNVYSDWYYRYYFLLRDDSPIARLDDGQSYELSITSPVNDGMYRCSVSPWGSAPKSNAIWLLVSTYAILPGPVSLWPSTNGTHILLTCHVDNITAYPRHSMITWYKNERVLEYSPKDDRIYELSMTSQDEGNYSCDIIESWTNYSPKSNTFEFDMSTFEATPPRPTIVYRRISNIHDTITCHVENRQEFSQPWSYRWWKNDELIALIFTFEHYPLYVDEDEGNYSCEMDAGGTLSPRSDTFEFQLPALAIPPRPTILNSTNGAYLTCHVEDTIAYSRPYSNFWWKNDELINWNSYILDLTVHGEGNYSCVFGARGVRSPRSETFHQLTITLIKMMSQETILATSLMT